MGSQAIAETTAVTPAKVHKGRGSALTQEQLEALVKLRNLGKTQVEIAETLGCNQATVSRWLESLTDSGAIASAYLRGKQLPLAKKFVKTARAADVLDLMDRFKSIPASSRSDTGQHLTIVVGGDSQMVFTAPLSPLSLASAGEGVENP